MSEKAREWTTFGRYLLLEKIGTGGMAEIFRAKTFGAAGFEKEFAIKLILPALIDDKEFVDMFINEAKIAVSLYHANIVQVFDLGEIDSHYYIAMEFVHGKDLLDVLARCAELQIHVPLHIVLFATMEMLKGLDFAHRAKDSFGEDLGIIHRDVSPSNIMISYAGDVKIGDFGVAKAAIQRNLTESGTLKGKVGYMSPEQVMGERIDARSDVFAAGIVFFEALSMSRLFTGGSDLDVMLRVRDADIRENLKRAEPIPSDLRDIVKKALSKHREERYQSAGEFYQALVDFCFKHNIKVTGSDLSNFMRRVFSEEIEKEKARRRADPHAPMASVLVRSSEVMQHSVTDTLEENGSHISEILSGASSPSEISGAPPTKYHYQNRDGQTHGPMTLTSLIALVKDKPPIDGDRVSIDGLAWIKPEDLSELSDILDAQTSQAQLVSGYSDTDIQSADELNVELSLNLESSGTLDTMEVSPASAVFKAHSKKSKALSDEILSHRAYHNLATQDTIDISALGELTSESPDEEGQGILLRSGSQLSVEDVEALREEFASYEGSMEDISFARMLTRLHRSKSTGKLQLKDSPKEKSIFFEQGEIILVDSNVEDELLGNFLINQHIITPTQLSDGLARLSEWGGRLGDALVATGAIPAHEIFRLLAEQMSEKLLEIFTWGNDGRFAFFENQEPHTHGYPLGVNSYDILVRGCRDYINIEFLTNYYKSRQHTTMKLSTPPPVDLNSLKLRANELRIVKQIGEGMSLHGLLRKFPPSQRNVIYSTIYLLHQSELLCFEQVDAPPESINFPS